MPISVPSLAKSGLTMASARDLFTRKPKPPLVARMMDPETQLTDAIHSQRMSRHRPDIDLLARQPGKGRIRQIGAGELLQNFATIGAGEHQHTPLTGHRKELHAGVGRQRLAQIIMIVTLESTGGNEIVTAFAHLVDGE